MSWLKVWIELSGGFSSITIFQIADYFLRRMITSKKYDSLTSVVTELTGNAKWEVEPARKPSITIV